MIGRRSHDDAQSFEEAWNGRAPKDEHIADLVRFAEDLCEAAAVEPSAAFRESLRERLMTEAATVLVAAPPAPRSAPVPERTRPSVRRRLASLTAVLVASTGVVTAVASSASAVPGEILYPVKRSVESVELALHRDDASRGSFQLAQATERLAEARALSAKGASDGLIVETLESFTTQATDGSSKLFSDYTDSGKERSIRKVNDFAATASADLTALSDQVPPSADDSLAAANETLSELATQATSLCSACTTADVESLVAAVTGLTRSEPVKKADPRDGDSSSSSKGSGTDASSTGSTPKGSTGSSTATQAPAVPAPTAAPTRTPSLSDVTDPLLGPLLGNDDQEGLVPGLLNGLLGGGKK